MRQFIRHTQFILGKKNFEQKQENESNFWSMSLTTKNTRT